MSLKMFQLESKKCFMLWYVLQVVILDYGHNTKNPFDTMTFYDRKNELIPNSFKRQFVSTLK